MNESRSHIIFRILRIIGFTLLALLALVGVLRLAIYTGVFNNFIKGKIVYIASENINGDLRIHTLEGDLWDQFTATNIHIVQEDTLVSIDTLFADYRILSLLNPPFQIQQISISGLSVRIEEEYDSTFNFQNIVKTDTASADKSESSFAVNVEQFNLRNSSIHVNSPSYLPDSTLTIKEFSADASFGMDDSFYLKLNSLQFQLHEGRLPQPVELYSSGSFEDEIITLSELAIETGRSMLNANGRFNRNDSLLKAEAKTSPLSLKDIEVFLSEPLPDNEIQMTLELSGKPDSLHIQIQAEGEGFNNFLLMADFGLISEPELRKLGVTAQNVNLNHFNPEINGEAGEIRISLNGSLKEDPESAALTFGFSLLNVRYEQYLVEQFFGSGTLKEGDLLANIQVKEGQSEILLHPSISNIFSDWPSWNVPIQLLDVNPYHFTGDPEHEGSVTLTMYTKGRGFQLNEEPWEYFILQNPHYRSQIPSNWIYIFKNLQGRMNTLSSSRAVKDAVEFAGQKFSDINVSGSINQELLKADGHIQLIENLIQFGATVRDFDSEKPSFKYKITSGDFNLAEVKGLETLRSTFNFDITGEGRNFDTSMMDLRGDVRIDSGYVNGAPVQQISLEYNLKDEMISISDGQLESEIARGSFSATKTLTPGISAEDELNLDLQIQNLQPLAEFANLAILQATGSITGVLRQNQNMKPEFDGEVQLQDIRADTLFRADEIRGSTLVEIDSTYKYNLDINVTAPTIAGVTFQDVDLQTLGTFYTGSLNGSITLQVQSRDAGNILQAIDYDINLDTLGASLTWNTLNFRTPARLLTLQKPFHLRYSDTAISTDTLSLRSEGGAYLNIAVPIADSLNQDAWIEGRNFDFGVIQEILFRERFVDGILSGEITAIRKSDFLKADGAIQIRNLNYKDAEIDSLEFQFSIADERLTAHGNLNFEGQEKIAGNINVPFVVGIPSGFDDAFFEEPVQGDLTIAPVDLIRFKTLLEDYNIRETEGIVSFNGSLGGTAGEPVFDGKINLDDPVLSGIRVDSAFAQFNYDHIAEKITAQAEIQARGQKAASIHADLPISVDFQTFEVITPEDSDTIVIKVLTENFNLSVFNDFVPDRFADQVQGKLNANVDIVGTVGNLKPQGKILMESGRVSIPAANIVLDKIGAELQFTPQGLQLQQLRMNSGGGRFTAKGSIEMEGIKPIGMDLAANAQQFKVANTDDYNLTIDLQSNITGSPLRPSASGQLTVRNGFIYLQDFGERSVEDVQLEGEPETSFSMYDSLALDMNLVISRNFFVRNDRYLDMEVEISGNLEAQKDLGGELQLFGSLSAEDGYARPLGKQFEVEEGEITFSGPVADPALFLRTSYIPQTSQKEGNPILLYYVIEGTVSDPVFRFESDPQMEQQDIIAYTLFGRPFYALDSWQQVMSGGGSSPANLLVDVLLDEVEALATRELGIDVVKIDNTRSGSDAVTSVTTGWYLNRRTFFSVVNEISANPKTLFILEYMLRENLDLILTQGDDNRQGIDLRWEYEY